MSTCISRHGEFGSHEPDDAYVCKLCGVLDEDGMVDELRKLRADLASSNRRLEAQLNARGRVEEVLDAALGSNEEDGTGEGLAADVALVVHQRDEARAALAAAKPEGWESVAALQEAYTTTDGWLEDARQECKQLRAELAQAREAYELAHADRLARAQERDAALDTVNDLRAALLRIAGEIPRLDGLDEERVFKGLEWIHQRACAALDGAAPSAVEAPAPDQTRDEARESGQRYLVWSNKQHAWWGHRGTGYRQDVRQAGYFSLDQAQECITRRTWVPGGWSPEVAIPAPDRELFANPDIEDRLRQLAMVVTQSLGRRGSDEPADGARERQRASVLAAAPSGQTSDEASEVAHDGA